VAPKGAIPVLQPVPLSQLALVFQPALVFQLALAPGRVWAEERPIWAEELPGCQSFRVGAMARA
jgi:hypothetical protein